MWHCFALSISLICLIWTSYVDLKTYILPDIFTAIVFVFGLFTALFDPLVVSAQGALFGAFAGTFGSWLLREIVLHWQKKEALGLGDVKLFGAAGIWVGAEGVVSVAFYGSLITIVVYALIWAATRRGSLKALIPYGPGICVGLVITLLIGPIGPYFVQLFN